MKKSVGITVVGGLAAATVFGAGVMVMRNRPVEADAGADIMAAAGEVVEASATTTEAGPQVMDVKAASEDTAAMDIALADGKTAKDTDDKRQAPEGTEPAAKQETETQTKGQTQKEQTEKGETGKSEENQGEMTETAGVQDTGTKEAGGELTPEEEKINDYLGDSVLIGDSIVLGYRNYCRKSEDESLHDIGFLAAGSFSAHNALWPVSDKSVHPVFQGQQRPVWESVSMMDVGNVFLCFGLNDLNIDDKTIECYKEVIDNILESSPDVQIHIISMTYTLKGQGKGRLNNDEIRVYNTKLKEMAQENGWGYVDLASALEDKEGNLVAEYCSDDFLHQNPAAYDVWTRVLREYVADWLNIDMPSDENTDSMDNSGNHTQNDADNSNRTAAADSVADGTQKSTEQ